MTKTAFLNKIYTRVIPVIILIAIGFVFLYPVLYMISTSLKSITDLLDPSVVWVPTKWYIENYLQSIAVLDYWSLLLETIYVAALPAVLQTIVASAVGYGFARFEFRGKNILLGVLLATFIIPPQVLIIPRYLLFNQLNMLDSIMAYALPAIAGQGINSAVFVLIFYQSFRTLPKALEEAAYIDGCGYFRTFISIAVPLQLASFIISFLFSFVWYWNEVNLAAIYFGNSLSTLPLQLQRFTEAFNQMFVLNDAANVNEGIEMAGTFLSILPLLIVYFIFQRYFVESVDKSGITGE